MDLLNIFSKDPLTLAAIDSDGQKLTIGEILALANLLEEELAQRSLLFILTENNVGGIAWVMAAILSGHVPLILSSHTDPGLLATLTKTYLPQYICLPAKMIRDNREGVMVEKFNYFLRGTNNPVVDLYPDLSHLLPTSGSTGSPKLVRHKYENIEAAGLNISTFFQLTENDRPLMVLPLHYTMGLSMVFSHLKVGATILITDLLCRKTNVLG